MIDINYLAVLVCAVLSMLVGGIWYGPLFGKKWMEIVGIKIEDMTPLAKKEMQKKMLPTYILQFALSIMQALILSYYVTFGSFIGVSGVCNAFLIWLGFIVPTLAGSVMWNNNSTKIKWTQFLIQAGYQLVIFIIFGLVLFFWQV
jgi:hypothetical protein